MLNIDTSIELKIATLKIKLALLPACAYIINNIFIEFQFFQISQCASFCDQSQINFVLLSLLVLVLILNQDTKFHTTAPLGISMQPAHDDEVLPEIPIPFERIKEIAFQTTGQRDNLYWKRVRAGKLTSSKFGQALNAMRKSHAYNIHKVREEIYFPKDLSRIPAVRWGIDHECDAIDAYTKKTGNIVKPTGIWLFPNGFMGASPDGLIYPNAQDANFCGIVEVKCPYSIRNCEVTNKFIYWGMLRYLTIDLKLKRDSAYYHQVQGEIFATGVEFCDFCIWTPKNDLLIIRIPRDEQWFAENFAPLEEFYRKYLMRAEDKPFDPVEDITEKDETDEWPSGMEPVPHADFNTILHPTTSESMHLHNLMCNAFELHLARLIYENHYESRSGIRWKSAVLQYWRLAVSAMCETCLRSLFYHFWNNSAGRQAPPEMHFIVERIKNEDEYIWSTMLYDIDFAETIRNDLLGYTPTYETKMPACTCRYTHYPAIKLR